MISILLVTEGQLAFEGFLNSRLLDAPTISTTNYNILIGMALAPTFYAISLVWNFINSLISTMDGQKRKIFDRREFIRASVIFGILSFALCPCWCCV